MLFFDDPLPAVKWFDTMKELISLVLEPTVILETLNGYHLLKLWGLLIRSTYAASFTFQHDREKHPRLQFLYSISHMASFDLLHLNLLRFQYFCHQGDLECMKPVPTNDFEPLNLDSIFSNGLLQQPDHLRKIGSIGKSNHPVFLASQLCSVTFFLVMT